MFIVYYDGSKLECHKIEYYGGSELIADDVYLVPLAEVDAIVEDERDL